MSPLFKYWAYVFPMIQIGAAFALWRKVNWLAWIMLLPYAILVVFTAVTVLTQ